MMKSIYNDGIGKRGRKPVAVLVTVDGQPHRFTQDSISGVCQSTLIGSEKKGKWSNRDYAVLYHDTTAFVSWMQDWDTGESWPQSSWDAGYRWLATKAPALKPGLFDAFIRANWPKTAEKWDAVAAGEAEFGKLATAEQLAVIEAGKIEIARINAEAEAYIAASRELANMTKNIREAQENHERASIRLAEVQAEAAAYVGLSLKTLNAETDAIWSEVRQMEDKLIAAHNKIEAENKKAELGNSLGNAFAALGL
jgi:hypothetical protein